MKKYFFCLLIFISQTLLIATKTRATPLRVFPANNTLIQYTGRIDFTNPLKPRFWSAGVYITIKFKGTGCEILMNDEVRNGNLYNFIEIAIDDKKPYRVQTNDLTNNIKAGGELDDTEHTITICKDTEAGVGYLEFIGIKCEKLLPLPLIPKHKIEFIGSSVTSGIDMDRSLYPCNFGEWYSHSNAYMSYGPVTARKLNAEWQVTAISGIGLTNSCCGLPVMPKAYDKLNTRNDTLGWNFNNYPADVVSINLGESDGAAALDSAGFCSAYINFLGDVRHYYPKADIICLNIATSNIKLNTAMKKYTAAISDYMSAHGDTKVYAFNITRIYDSGCNGHPDMGDHTLIANELSEYIKTLRKW